MKPMGPLRTALFVPATRPDRVDKALGAGADVVIIDLEDAVAQALKGEARETARKKVIEHASRRLMVRVNALGSGHNQDDLQAIVGASPSGIMLPKVESVEHIREIHERLLRLRTSRRPAAGIVGCRGADRVGTGGPKHFPDSVRSDRADPRVFSGIRCSRLQLGHGDRRQSRRRGVALPSVPDRGGMSGGRAGAADRHPFYDRPEGSGWPHRRCAPGQAARFSGQALHPSQPSRALQRDFFTDRRGDSICPSGGGGFREKRSRRSWGAATGRQVHRHSRSGAFPEDHPAGGIDRLSETRSGRSRVDDVECTADFQGRFLVVIGGYAK